MDRRQQQTSMKPRGKRNAFIFFTMSCREEQKKFFPNETISFTDFGRRCSERWKTLGDAEKQRFLHMAEDDKKRHASEMQFYVPSKGHGKYRSRDPNSPKRPLCPFFMFCHCERNRVKLMYPGNRVADVTKILARLWAEAGPEMKSKYEQMSIQDKARYQMEMSAYKKNGQAPTQYHNRQNDGLKGSSKCL